MLLSNLVAFMPLFIINHANNANDRDPVVDKPNIVFIMADDLGWGNVGYHNKANSEISTPNIDYLVANGLQLNRHYVDPECSPSRSSFQSGRLPVHVNTNNNDGILDSTMGVHPDMTGIASKLKSAGYSTHMIGKWDCGFASFRQLPINKGYDTYYGYLGKSIGYYSKKGDAICSKYYVDLWEDDHPAYDNIDDVDKEEYVEHTFADRVLTTIDDMAVKEDPFFIFYSSHLPHYPVQLPPTCIADGLYEEFERDTDMCRNMNLHMVSLEYTDDRDLWKCRSILQAQVGVLDDIVGQITTKLQENGLWDNTLIVFSTDNGGSLELDKTAGNNYPLRGGKASVLEGGIRATAFVSGGYLPPHSRGHLTDGLMHIADWYATFSEMVGVDPADVWGEESGLPPIDGYNMWPLIAGETDESPRSELILSKNVLIWDEWKIILGGSTRYAIWQGAKFPNETTPTQEELEATFLICDSKKNWGCLFNVVEDPTEHVDLADDNSEKVSDMRARIYELRAGFYNSDFAGKESCPDGFHLDSQSEEVSTKEYKLRSASEDSVSCGCWMSQHNWGLFAGPFMDLPQSRRHFDEGADKTHPQQVDMDSDEEMMVAMDIGKSETESYTFVMYVALTVATVVLLLVSCRNCKKTRERQIQNKLKLEVSNYGTV
eukprot:426954_1